MSAVSAELLRAQLELLGVPESESALFAAALRPELLEATRETHPTCLWQGRYLHSRFAPRKEAERAAAAIQVENSQQLVLFVGAGLAYVIAEFCKRHDNPAIWFEPNREILALALGLTDLCDAVRAGRLSVFTGEPDDETLREMFRGRTGADVVFAIHRASADADEQYGRLETRLVEHLNKKNVNLATLARFDRIWAKNLVFNFPALRRARPVARLFDCAPGATALVCGAGPSLYDDLQRLKLIPGARENAIWIAVDTALAPLHAAGFTPDVTVSVDPQALNRYYLEGFADASWIVIDPTTTYLTPRLAGADRLVFTSSPFALAKLFFDYCEESVGELAFGGSVSTNAYDLAVRMGCRRILLVGQDLAFTNGLAHSPGATLEERLNFRERRTFRRELHNYRQLSALPVRGLPGAVGPVPTNDKLTIFYRWFARRFRSDRARGVEIYNLTGGGAVFEDAPGGDAARLFAESRPLRFDDCARERLARPLDFRGRDFDQRLAALALEFTEYGALLARGEDLAARSLELARADDHGPEYRRLQTELGRLEARALNQPELSAIAGGAVQSAIFQITENFRNASAALEKENPHLALAEKTHALYRGLRQAVELHARWFSKVLATGRV